MPDTKPIDLKLCFKLTISLKYFTFIEFFDLIVLLPEMFLPPKDLLLNLSFDRGGKLYQFNLGIIIFLDAFEVKDNFLIIKNK